MTPVRPLQTVNFMRRACSVVTALVVACQRLAGRRCAARVAPGSGMDQDARESERIASLRTGEVIAKLNLKPSDVVADLGAGTGLFSLPLAKAVPSGRVYAVELDEGFLTQIRGKAKSENVTNIVPVLGKFTDPSLPARDVDVAFFHDVLHHVENRAAYLKSVAGYLEARRSDRRDRIQPRRQPAQGRARADREQGADGGLDGRRRPGPGRRHPVVPDKYFVVYRRK